LAKNEYIIRHDKAYTLVHYSVCKKLGIETAESGTHTYLRLHVNMKIVTVLWNHGIQTDRLWTIGQT